MNSSFIVGFLMFVMKYFFDMEKEITQQLLWTVDLRINDCKEFMSNVYHLVLMDK